MDKDKFLAKGKTRFKRKEQAEITRVLLRN